MLSRRWMLSRNVSMVTPICAAKSAAVYGVSGICLPVAVTVIIEQS